MPKLREKLKSKKTRRWLLVGIAVVAVGAFLLFRYIKAKQTELPEGIASGNGRIESKEVDVASKLALKVKQVLVDEGELVKPGQVLVRMDTVTLESELAEAKEAMAAAQLEMAVAKAAIARRRAEVELARIEVERSRNLLAERAGSQREYDVRVRTVQTTRAGFAEDQAKLQVAAQRVKVAQANMATIQSEIDDATLESPVLGRVLYRLAEPGEVLEAGGKALTLVDLQDVYMEIFLPSAQASRVEIGAEARFKLDYEPDRVGVGYVSFVSPEAQFTPKEVETPSEREKLMFRAKIQIPRELVLRYIERVKTGIRGVAYVKVDESARWPDWLNRNLVRPRREERPPQVTPAAASRAGSRR